MKTWGSWNGPTSPTIGFGGSAAILRQVCDQTRQNMWSHFEAPFLRSRICGNPTIFVFLMWWLSPSSHRAREVTSQQRLGQHKWIKDNGHDGDDDLNAMTVMIMLTMMVMMMIIVLVAVLMMIIVLISWRWRCWRCSCCDDLQWSSCCHPWFAPSRAAAALRAWIPIAIARLASHTRPWPLCSPALGPNKTELQKLRCNSSPIVLLKRYTVH